MIQLEHILYNELEQSRCDFDEIFLDLSVHIMENRNVKIFKRKQII